MTIATSTEQQAIAGAVADWAAAKEVRALVRTDVDAGGSSWRSRWPEIADLGVFAAGVAEEFGGAGGTAAD
ncbi:MAG: acyl-CoA dehydrogenase family protein, partial [Gordonia sp. (in: high G+C Gram-positive bacteria)]|uniref:acyl-CoA dehydrogenase family protein n=1 Tax=Gordonia sp. (in: high G+C Gram-positive bacteria) TaxID=84139 RepID=UPI003BB5654D